MVVNWGLLTKLQRQYCWLKSSLLQYSHLFFQTLFSVHQLFNQAVFLGKQSCKQEENWTRYCGKRENLTQIFEIFRCGGVLLPKFTTLKKNVKKKKL
jgi:hypothetical protein